MKMLKPLNSFVYIKNNPKKIIPQVFAVSLGVFLIYFICMIGGGLKYGLNNDVIVPYEKMSIVTIRYPEKDNDELYNYFSKNNNVQKIMYSSGIENITAKLIINSSGTCCPYLNEDNIKYMMNMYNFKLQSGRLPQNNNEVLFNENFCKSRNLNVGDYYGTDVNSKDSLDGKYKITGTFKGDIIMSFVYDSKSIDEIKNYPYSIDETKNHPYNLILIAKKGHLTALNKDIHSFLNSHKNQYGFDDYDKQYSFLGTMFVMFNVFAVIILGLTVFVITFTLGDINYVHFCERLYEFSMLESLGYSKKDIKHKQLLEMILTTLVGTCFGFILSLLGGFIFNEIYCFPNGTPIKIISPWYILLGILVPVLVFFFSCISTGKLVNKMEIVDVLQGRV